MRALFTEYSTYLVAGLVALLGLMRLVLLLARPGSPAARAVLALWHPEARRPEADPAAVHRAVAQNMDSTLLALAVVFGVLRPLVVQAFYIPSASMEPTLLGNSRQQDRVLVNKYLYALREPRRGDIVVFEAPEAALRTSGAGNKEYIKRLIGEPGDTVEVRGHEVWIDGAPLHEPYLRDRVRHPFGRANGDWGPAVVPPGQYLMMGDNRDNSSDGRVWGFLPRENIIGKASAVFWPPRAAKLLDDRCRPLGAWFIDRRAQIVVCLALTLLSLALAWSETRRQGRAARAAALAAAVVVSGLLIARPVLVTDEAAAPELHRGDIVLAAPYCPYVRGPRRGDLVRLSEPETGLMVVRRVVGLPGEVVDLQAGELIVDGWSVEAPWLPAGERGWWGPERVASDHLCLWSAGGHGPALVQVPLRAVRATVLARLWRSRGGLSPAAASASEMESSGG